MRRLRIGVIGCGMVAQVMHLPHLTELAERYDLVALCDLSLGLVSALGERLHVERRYTDYEKMLDEGSLDGVLVLTLSHFEPAFAALRRGISVLVEKPMCHTLREADALVEAAETSRATLMVGYMKRYDPAYLYFQARVRELTEPRLIRVHDVLGPNDWIIRDLLVVERPNDLPADVVEASRRSIAAKLAEAIGDERAFAGAAYGLMLGLCSHDVTILRGVFGSPRRIVGTQIASDGRFFTALLDFGDDLLCTFAAGAHALKRFEEELVVWGTDRVVKISFPSPFVKNMPTLVEVHEQERTEGQNSGASPYVEHRITASYEEAFKRELLHFSDCVCTGATPLTNGREAREDTRLMIDLIRAGLAPARHSTSGL